MDDKYNGYVQTWNILKEDLSSVHTQCRVRDHGYIGNILFDTQYSLIYPGTTFVV